MTLFFIAAGLLLLHIASTMFIPLSAWWPGLVLLVLWLRLRTTPSSWQLSIPGAWFVAFCLLLLLQVMWISPVYDAKAIYLAFTLLLPFLIFSCLPSAGGAFRVATGIAAVVAYLALVLWFNGVGFGTRADIIFGTPNTFATYLNLFLAPLLGYYLFGKGGRGVYWLILLIFTTLLAAQSRGGYLALAVSMVFFGMLVGAKVLHSNKRRVLAVLTGFTGTALFLELITRSGISGIGAWEGASRVLEMAKEGDVPRVQLYTIAWQTIQEHFPAGTGTFSFKFALEKYKLLLWQDRHTSFVHNDYLQLAAENGLLGIGLFLAVMAALYFYLAKYRHQVVDEQRLPLIMSATGLTTILAHAMVDFPFYVPLFQAMIGAYLGVINRQLVEMGARRFDVPNISKWKLPGLSAGFIKDIATLGLIVWLGLPFYAKLAADYGYKRLTQTDFQGAVYWHSIASTLQPRAQEYYWRLGVIWSDLGGTRRDASMIETSDAMFAKAFEANPLDSNQLLNRISLRRKYHDMLPQISQDEMMAWMLQAKRMQPVGINVQVEYVRTLAYFGRFDEAIEQAGILLNWRPENRFAQALLADVKARKLKNGKPKL